MVVAGTIENGDYDVVVIADNGTQNIITMVPIVVENT
jgi:hypothetical protein